MAAYIGHTVTVELKNSGGKFCGKLIRTDNVKGMIVLSKGNVSHNKLHVCRVIAMISQVTVISCKPIISSCMVGASCV